MRFYIASSFDCKGPCEQVYESLLKHGHEVPDIWWNIDAKSKHAKDKNDNNFYGDSSISSIAARHWNTIQTVDAVILVSDFHAPFSLRQFTGANVEVGYAIGIGKPVFSVGHLKRSAMYSTLIKCKDIWELEEAIKIFSLSKR